MGGVLSFRVLWKRLSKARNVYFSDTWQGFPVNLLGPDFCLGQKLLSSCHLFFLLKSGFI